MLSVFKSSFFRLFTTGFVAGVVGVMALQPAEATRFLDAPTHHGATR